MSNTDRRAFFQIIVGAIAFKSLLRRPAADDKRLPDDRRILTVEVGNISVEEQRQMLDTIKAEILYHSAPTPLVFR